MTMGSTGTINYLTDYSNIFERIFDYQMIYSCTDGVKL